MVRAAINKVNQTTSQKDKIEWMNPFIVSDNNFSGFAAFGQNSYGVEICLKNGIQRSKENSSAPQECMLLDSLGKGAFSIGQLLHLPLFS